MIIDRVEAISLTNNVSYSELKSSLVALERLAEIVKESMRRPRDEQSIDFKARADVFMWIVCGQRENGILAESTAYAEVIRRAAHVALQMVRSDRHVCRHISSGRTLLSVVFPRVPTSGHGSFELVVGGRYETEPRCIDSEEEVWGVKRLPMALARLRATYPDETRFFDGYNTGRRSRVYAHEKHSTIGHTFNEPP